MNSVEFGKAMKPLNLKYKEIFDYIPCISDYSCSREEYIEAMEESLVQRRKLSDFLTETISSKSIGAET